MNQHERNAREERMQIRAGMKPILDKLGRGERLSFQERTDTDKATNRISELEAEIRTHQQAGVLSAEAWAKDSGAPNIGQRDTSAEGRAFNDYIRFGTTSPELRAMPLEQRAVPLELRAAGETTNIAGGFLVPPGWWQRLQVALKAFGGTSNDFEQLETDTGQPMNWATNDPTGTLAVLQAENSQILDVDFVFGQGTMSAYLYAAGVHKVSVQLAQDSAFNVENYLTARMGEELGRAQAAAAISGTGSSQPLGIVTALGGITGATSGGTFALGAAQKVQELSSTPATAGTDTSKTELQANVLAPSSILGLIKQVDPAYRALGSKFYMNDAMLHNLRALVDGFGRPYYAALQDDVSPKLHGYAVTVDNNLPNLTASVASGVIFGHVQSAMTLRRVKGGSIMALHERYADFLQVGYIGYQRIDIRSNDLRAAAVTLPAAT